MEWCDVWSGGWSGVWSGVWSEVEWCTVSKHVSVTSFIRVYVMNNSPKTNSRRGTKTTSNSTCFL